MKYTIDRHGKIALPFTFRKCGLVLVVDGVVTDSGLIVLTSEMIVDPESYLNRTVHKNIVHSLPGVVVLTQGGAA